MTRLIFPHEDAPVGDWDGALLFFIDHKPLCDQPDYPQECSCGLDYVLRKRSEAYRRNAAAPLPDDEEPSDV